MKGGAIQQGKDRKKTMRVRQRGRVKRERRNKEREKGKVVVRGGETDNNRCRRSGLKQKKDKESFNASCALERA